MIGNLIHQKGGTLILKGYTHAAIGAGGAIAISMLLSSGKQTSDLIIVATVAGVVGGITVDVDVMYKN